MISIDKFEYDNIIVETKYFCKFYYIDNIDYHSDFIVSDAIDKYVSYKNRVNYINNEKIKCSIIKNICKTSVLKYIKNNIYKLKSTDENELFYNDEDLLKKKKIIDVINMIFESLNDTEKVIFEMLEEGKKKKEIINILNIDSSIFKSFIEKLKSIVDRYID